MYHYHQGEIKNPGFSGMIAFLQVIYYLLIGLILGGIGVVAGLPLVASGTIGGVVAVLLFIRRSFAEPVTYVCPECGQKIKTLRNFGHYRCSVCGTESQIQEAVFDRAIAAKEEA